MRFAVSYCRPDTRNRFFFRHFKLVDGIAYPVGCQHFKVSRFCPFFSELEAFEIASTLSLMGYQSSLIPDFAFDSNVSPAVFKKYF